MCFIMKEHELLHVLVSMVWFLGLVKTRNAFLKLSSIYMLSKWVIPLLAYTWEVLGLVPSSHLVRIGMPTTQTKIKFYNFPSGSKLPLGDWSVSCTEIGTKLYLKNQTKVKVHFRGLQFKGGTL